MIRPVDMQVVVQKVQDIHPAKQHVVNKQDNELIQTQNEAREQERDKQQMVIGSEETRHNAIRGDREGAGTDGEGTDKKKKKASDEDENDQDTKKESVVPQGNTGRHFDMKV